MVAVRGGNNGGVVVADVLSACGPGAVGQDDVVFGEAFFNGRRGRNDYDELGPESDGEDGAEGLGEFVEGAVEWLFDEVEVADDRKRRWAWREVVGVVEFS